MTRVILFDLGNVLIEWNVHFLFDKLIPDETARNYFLDHVCNFSWNAERDRGMSRAEAERVLVAQFPAYKELIQAYSDRWIDTLGQPIAGTVAILKELKSAGYTLYAASNWAADNFELARERMSVFLPLFDGMQISGQVGLIKPDAAFFEHMMKEFSFLPSEALFIDDNKDNVTAAEKLGIKSILFKNPEALREELSKLNVL